MPILNINGLPYTSATEDLTLNEHKKRFAKALHAEILRGLRTAKGPNVQINLPALMEFIDQAYYLGKENAVK